MWGRLPKIQNLFIKGCLFILTCLNFSHLQSTLHLMQYTCWVIFSTAENSFWTHWHLCLLVFLPFFVSPLSHIGKCFPLKTFFIQGNKSLSSEIRWIRSEGQGDHEIFGQKLLTLSIAWIGVLLNHSSWNGQTLWKSLQKKIHWSQMQPLTTTPAGTLIQKGFPHLLSGEILYYKGPALQKIILLF